MLESTQPTAPSPTPSSTVAAGRRPPGPTGHFMLGALGELGEDPLAFFTGVHRQFGDVVRVPIGPTSLYVIAHPDHIEQVLL